MDIYLVLFASKGSLKGLKVTMKKHPSSFKLSAELEEKNDKVGDDPVVLYEGMCFIRNKRITVEHIRKNQSTGAPIDLLFFVCIKASLI